MEEQIRPDPSPEEQPSAASQPVEEVQQPQTDEQEKPLEDPEDNLAYNIYYWLQTLVIAVVFIVLLFSFVGRVIRVVGESMLQTLHEGDLVFTQSLGYIPRSGDVVVLNKMTPEASQLLDGETIVKRIVATEGQHVEIDYANSAIYVDGQKLDEPYLWEPMTPRANPYMQQTSFVVPENCVFVMGDNRNNSTDSRHEQLGMIDRRYILGRAVIILFPFSNFGTL